MLKHKRVLTHELRLPYVQEGLTAHYDGRFNAGIGLHDPAAAAWVDLSGNGHDGRLTAGAAGDTSGWGTDHYLFQNTTACFQLAGSFSDIQPGGYTLQFVVQPLTGKYTSVLTSTADWSTVAGVSTTDIGVWHFPEFGKGAVMYSSCSPYITWTEILENNQFRRKVYSYSNNQWDYQAIASSGGMPASLQIGGSTVWSPAYSRIYAVRIYNRVLTQQEIQLNYSIDKSRFGL